MSFFFFLLKVQYFRVEHLIQLLHGERDLAPELSASGCLTRQHHLLNWLFYFVESSGTLGHNRACTCGSISGLLFCSLDLYIHPCPRCQKHRVFIPLAIEEEFKLGQVNPPPSLTIFPEACQLFWSPAHRSDVRILFSVPTCAHIF